MLVPPGKYYALVVSDIHLGHTLFGDDSASLFKGFLDELESAEPLEIEHLVILGDFLDLWRDDDYDLFIRYKGILTRLAKLKEDGKITNLQYVVGNHDFTIPDIKKGTFEETAKPEEKRQLEEMRRLLEPFAITEPYCVEPTPLLLPEDGSSLNGKSFTLRHGHQDEVGALGPVYDLSSVWLCGQNKEAGDFTSLLYKHKFELVFIALAIVTSYLFITGNLLWAIIFSVGTTISAILWLLNYLKHRKTKKFLEVLQEKPSVRREKLRKMNEELKAKEKEPKGWQMIAQRIELKEVDESTYPRDKWKDDYQDIQQVLQQRIGRLPDRYKILRDDILSKEGRGEAITITPQDILIRGHTHITVKGVNNEYNTGGWVEEAEYCILLIDENGNINMSSCTFAPKPS